MPIALCVLYYSVLGTRGYSAFKDIVQTPHLTWGRELQEIKVYKCWFVHIKTQYNYNRSQSELILGTKPSLQTNTAIINTNGLGKHRNFILAGFQSLAQSPRLIQYNLFHFVAASTCGYIKLIFSTFKCSSPRIGSN